jgi:hypothetical protein
MHLLCGRQGIHAEFRLESQKSHKELEDNIKIDFWETGFKMKNGRI